MNIHAHLIADSDDCESPYRRLAVGSKYKYGDICDALGERRCGGNQRSSQLKRWSEHMSWENPTRQSYVITEIFDSPRRHIDGRTNNGGSRSNSGRKKKLYDDFLYLFNSFMHREFNRNSSGGHGGGLCVCRFTGNEISKYFGLYSDTFNNAVSDYAEHIGCPDHSERSIHDDNVQGVIDYPYGVADYSSAWSDISKCIAGMRRRWVYDRIESLENVTLGYGVIGYRGDGRDDFDYIDDRLDEWNSYMRRFMDRHDLKNEGIVAERGMYIDMIANISLNFDEYSSVERVRKVEFDTSMLRDYDFAEIESHRLAYNSEVVSGLMKSLDRKGKLDDIHMSIIDEHVKLAPID